MSLDPLRVLVRRLRSAASADDAQLSAAFAALPHGELVRLYYFCRDAVQEARDTGLGYDTDGSSEFDLPGLDALPGRAQSVLTQVATVDLLGVEPNLVDLDQVTVAPAAASAATAAAVVPPASLVAEVPLAPTAGGDPVVSGSGAPCDAVGASTPEVPPC